MVPMSRLRMDGLYRPQCRMALQPSPGSSISRTTELASITASLTRLESSSLLVSLYTGAKLYPGDTGCHYNYHGNGTLEHFNPDSKYWVYRADYVYSKNRSSYRRDKAPWESPPSNVSISFPETVVPFRAAYDASNMRYMEGNVTLVPVANSAGDLITAETHNYAIQLSFSYCLEPKDFSLEKVFFCNHSVNKNKIKVCGITFDAESAMITNLSPQYHEETTDSSQKKIKHINTGKLELPFRLTQRGASSGGFFWTLGTVHYGSAVRPFRRKRNASWRRE